MFTVGNYISKMFKMQSKCMCHMRSDIFSIVKVETMVFMVNQNVVRQIFFTFLEKYTAYIPDASTFLQNFSNHPSYETVS
jgi:hypothetical protein